MGQCEIMRGPQLAFYFLVVAIYSAITVEGFTDLTERQVAFVIRKAASVVRSQTPTAVRLTFHDCVGGCDGCLNVNNPDNAGLEDIVADLEEVYTTEGLDSIISRADMWALMGIWAINSTIDNNNNDCAAGTHNNANCVTVPDLQVTFQWGREDCATAPYSDTDVHLPAGTLGHTDTMDFFFNEFGFSDRETTALMGAHTLGAALITQSGFHGTWVSNEVRYFNNQYYTNIADSSLSWKKRQRTCESLNDVDLDLTTCAGMTTGWQWQSPGVGFNINPDMGLYLNFTVSTDGEASCDYDACSLSSTAPDVVEFSGSNTIWIDEFSKVYTKMLQHGYTSLNDVSD